MMFARSPAVFFAQAGMRGMRGLDGAARFGRAHVRHGAEQLAVGGIADLGSLSRVGGRPRAGDEAVLLPQRRSL